ncbi:MAG TPA: hypothetical protein VEL04_03615 [Burkholderiales bacterium]|nr:hypothetical protein [Burkholderiales bacterium]
MRVIGSRTAYRVRAHPSGAALKAGAAHQAVAASLAAVPTTGVARGIYRFASHAEANAHSEEAQARAIAQNLRARHLIP